MNTNPISPKVTTATLAGAVVLIVVWVLSTYAAVEVPPEVASAASLILMAGAAYFKRDPQRDTNLPA